MLAPPRAAEPLARAFAPCFSDRVSRRFVLLLAGAVLVPRRRCVTSILRVVVLAAAVRLPGLNRPRAPPVLACLCRGEAWCAANGRRSTSRPVVARPMAAAMLRRFPRRRFVLLGGGGFATHGLARAAFRRRGRLTSARRCYDDAALTARPETQGEARPGHGAAAEVRGEAARPRRHGRPGRRAGGPAGRRAGGPAGRRAGSPAPGSTGTAGAGGACDC